MEDQSHGAGDLTDAVSEVDGAEADSTEIDSAEDELDGTSAEDQAAEDELTDDGDGDGECVGETAAAQRRPRRKLSVRIAIATSAAAFVAAAAFAAGAAEPYLQDRAEVAVKLDIARTAARAIHTLWNYTPENMDTLPDRAAVYLSGDLEAQYRKFIDAIAPGNKQAKVTDTTEIVGAAVESLKGSDATVLIYTNTSATSALSKSIPQIKYLTYRLYMRRDDRRWVVTRMPTITSLDLTPHLQN